MEYWLDVGFKHCNENKRFQEDTERRNRTKINGIRPKYIHFIMQGVA